MKDFILSKLMDKSIDTHYAIKYINFIFNCIVKNESIDLSKIYTENHHILPRAQDMYPQYANLKIYGWNKVTLTARQHLIAHIMLWRAVGKSQIFAAYIMAFGYKNNSNKFNAHHIWSPNINTRLFAALREEHAKSPGKHVYLDSDNKKYHLTKDDVRIEELNLQSHIKGKGRFQFKDDGEYYGMLKLDSPLIKELGLEPVCTDLMLAQRRDRTEKGNVRNTNTSRYNNGALEIMLPIGEEIPDGFIKGCLPASEEQITKKLKGLMSYQEGKIAYNNGERLIRLFPNEEVPEGFVKGMLRRKHKNRVPSWNIGKSMFNDGNNIYYIDESESIPEGLIKGGIKHHTVKKQRIHIKKYEDCSNMSIGELISFFTKDNGIVNTYRLIKYTGTNADTRFTELFPQYMDMGFVDGMVHIVKNYYDTRIKEITQFFIRVDGKVNVNRVKQYTDKDIHNELVELTPYLDGRSLSDRIIILKKGITHNPRCEVCNVEVPVNKDIIYNTCGTKCGGISKQGKSLNISEETKEIANIKRQETMIEKYGVAFNSQREEVKDKLGTHCSTDEFKTLMSDIQKAKWNPKQYD